MATTNGTVIASGEINIHIVDVGMNDSMLFAPNDVKAAPGDIVSFRFWNNHSVVESQYGFPCVPNNDLTGRPIFYSGFHEELNATQLLNPPTWNLTVNDTSPVYFYCSVPGSCINYGMVGAINPRGPGDVANQIAWAKEADFMVPPGQPLPSGSFSSLVAMTGVQPTGVPQNNSSSSQTFSSTPTSAPSATSSPTSPPSSSSSSSLSAGVIAGIVLGIVALILISIGIWFAMRRTKRLLVALEGNQREPEEPKPPIQYDEAMRGEPSYRSHDSVTIGYPGWQSPMHPHDKPTPTIWSSPSMDTEAFSDHRPERQRSELFGDTTAPRVHEMYVAPGRNTIE